MKKYVCNVLLIAAITFSNGLVFAQRIKTSPSNVTFGHPSSNAVPCSGNGICATGANAGGVSGSWIYNATYNIAGVGFNVQDATSNAGFVAPNTTNCPNCQGCGTYSIDATYTFSGNDGTGVPAGYYVPAGTQATWCYWSACNCGSITFTVYPPANASAKAQKAQPMTAEQKKQASMMAQEAMKQVAAKAKKKK